MSLMKHRNYFLFCLIFFFSACKKLEKLTTGADEKVATDKITKPVLKLPETPESLVRAWEDHVNNNEFELPRMISKGEVLNFVNSVEASNADQKLPVFPMKILTLKCDELDNVANCTCRIQQNDSSEQTFQYSLVKDNGQWYLTKVESEEELAPTSKVKNINKSIKPL